MERRPILYLPDPVSGAVMVRCAEIKATTQALRATLACRPQLLFGRRGSYDCRSLATLVFLLQCPRALRASPSVKTGGAKIGREASTCVIPKRILLASSTETSSWHSGARGPALWVSHQVLQDPDAGVSIRFRPSGCDRIVLPRCMRFCNAPSTGDY